MQPPPVFDWTEVSRLPVIPGSPDTVTEPANTQVREPVAFPEYVDIQAPLWAKVAEQQTAALIRVPDVRIAVGAHADGALRFAPDEWLGEPESFDTRASESIPVELYPGDIIIAERRVFHPSSSTPVKTAFSIQAGPPGGTPAVLSVSHLSGPGLTGARPESAFASRGIRVEGKERGTDSSVLEHCFDQWIEERLTYDTTSGRGMYEIIRDDGTVHTVIVRTAPIETGFSGSIASFTESDDDTYRARIEWLSMTVRRGNAAWAPAKAPPAAQGASLPDGAPPAAPGASLPDGAPPAAAYRGGSTYMVSPGSPSAPGAIALSDGILMHLPLAIFPAAAQYTVTVLYAPPADGSTPPGGSVAPDADGSAAADGSTPAAAVTDPASAGAATDGAVTDRAPADDSLSRGPVALLVTAVNEVSPELFPVPFWAERPDGARIPVLRTGITDIAPVPEPEGRWLPVAVNLPEPLLSGLRRAIELLSAETILEVAASRYRTEESLRRHIAQEQGGLSVVSDASVPSDYEILTVLETLARTTSGGFETTTEYEVWIDRILGRQQLTDRRARLVRDAILARTVPVLDLLHENTTAAITGYQRALYAYVNTVLKRRLTIVIGEESVLATEAGGVAYLPKSTGTLTLREYLEYGAPRWYSLREAPYREIDQAELLKDL